MKTLVSITIMLMVLINLYTKKTTFELVKLNSFSAPAETKAEFQQYYAYSDSIIYLVDISDSTKTTVYSFDYLGAPIDSFFLSKNNGYNDLMWTNYLYKENCLVLNNYTKNKLDYYALDGRFIKKKPAYNTWAFCINLFEYKTDTYYTELNLKDDNNERSYCFYKVINDSILVLLQRELIPADDSQVMFSDANRNNYYSVLIVTDKSYHITYYNNFAIEFNINHSKKVILSNYQIGNNFVVLYQELKGKKKKPSSNVYNLNGKYLGDLNNFESKYGSLHEILGDKMIFYNDNTNTFTICKIEMKR